MKDGRPLVSVITVARNAARTIHRTIDSIVSQGYSPLEYIVIDGGSSDATPDIVRSYGGRIAYFVSEPDHGISDAFNKGVNLAKGKYVTFVNADDWLSPEQIATAVEILEAHPEASFVFGDLLHHRGGKPGHVQKGSADYRRFLRFQMGSLNHPTMVCRREMFAGVGPFDMRYRIAMDFHWLQRAHHVGFSGVYSDRIRGNMESGGISGAQGFAAIAEARRSAIETGENSVAVWAYWLWASTKFALRRLVEQRLSYAAAIALRRRVFRSVDRPPQH